MHDNLHMTNVHPDVFQENINFPYSKSSLIVFNVLRSSVFIRHVEFSEYPYLLGLM